MMKIILSRKGFDSGAGGYPNPILPSGRLCVLPIPDKRSIIQYRHIHVDDDSLPKGMNRNLGSLVSQLTGRRISPLRRAHLDPDLDAGNLPRKPEWRPLFGQRGAALGHLQKQAVGLGDLFLFFGWFKQTEAAAGRLRYMRDAPDVHVIFGWLQVGCMLDLSTGDSTGDSSMPKWIHDHPHAQPAFQKEAGKSGNTLYISSRRLDLPGLKSQLPGGGEFTHSSHQNQLSKGDTLRSIWLLPSWFMPTGQQTPLTYHGDPSRWQPEEDGVLLRTVGRGQEFVLNCDEYPESLAWLHAFFEL